MQFAVITDIHANIYALKATLEDIKKKGIDKVYCLGDLVGYAPFPNEVIDLIKEEKIVTIQGNYDESVGEELFACGCDYKDEKTMAMGTKSLYWSQENTTAENKTWLKNLPKQLELEIEGKKIVLVHGSTRRNNEYLYENSEELKEIAKTADFNVLICGHTHKPFHEVVEGVHFINAGSVGKPKHGNPQATYVIVEINQEDIKTQNVEVIYDYERAAKEVEESELPNEFAEKLRKGIS